jgi:GLPGLI family protein
MSFSKTLFQQDFPAKRNCFLALSLWMLLLPIAGKTQITEGSIRYLVTHNWSKKIAAVDYISKQQKERNAYMWGNTSEWKIYSNLYFTPSETAFQDSEEKAEVSGENSYSWRKDAYFIKRNFATNKESDVIQILGKIYIIEDTLQAPNWKILNNLKEIAGHQCMNAFWQDTVKNQKVSAWFALDMPISGGPERFFGLPGMILEVDINDGGMLLTADRIESKKLTTELNPSKKYKGSLINEAGYLTILKKHMVEKRKAEEPYFWGIRY